MKDYVNSQTLRSYKRQKDDGLQTTGHSHSQVPTCKVDALPESSDLLNRAASTQKEI